MHRISSTRLWSENLSHREFFDEIADHLKLNDIDQWYGVTKASITPKVGRKLLEIHYDSKISDCLLHLYPDTHWQTWRFKESHGYWIDPSKHTEFFDWISHKLNISSEEDWYGLSKQEVIVFGGGELLACYFNSLSNALRALYPQITWQPWRFRDISHTFWHKQAHQRQYFDWIAEELSVGTLDDWYRVSFQQIESLHGGSLLDEYHLDICAALKKAYPFTSFADAPTSFKEEHFHRQYFDWMAEQLQLLQVEDWYTCTRQDLFKYGEFMSYYDGFLVKALCAVFPDTNWELHKFEITNYDYWNNVDTVRIFLDVMAEDWKVGLVDDWYQIDFQVVQERNKIIRHMLAHYGNFPRKALIAAYGDTEWYPWKFGQVPFGFWTDLCNHRLFFDWVGDQLQLLEMEGWYSVHSSSVDQLGGSGLMELHYGNSISRAVCSVYKEYPWQLWRFEHLPQDFWEQDDHHRQYFDWFADQQQVALVEDWYKVQCTNTDVNATKVLDSYYYGKLDHALMSIYPDTSWKPWIFSENLVKFIDSMYHLEFMEWLGECLQVVSQHDWYAITKDSCHRFGGLRIFSCYEDSLALTLMNVYSTTEWQIWRFEDYPRQNELIHRQYFDWLAEQLNVHALAHWYELTMEDIRKHGGNRQIETMTPHELHTLLANCYPDTNWHAWKFLIKEHWMGTEGPMTNLSWFTEYVVGAEIGDEGWELWNFAELPEKFWADVHNQRCYLDWVAEGCGVNEVESWYEVTKSDRLQQAIGRLVYTYYEGDLPKLFQCAYPNTAWEEWRFNHNSHWNSSNNNRQFLDWLQEKMHVTTINDLHKLVADSTLGGHAVNLNESPWDALIQAYPDTQWIPWRFGKMVTWKDDINQHREYFDWLADGANVMKSADWYKVCKHDECGTVLALFYQNSISLAISKIYPNAGWFLSAEWNALPAAHWKDRRNHHQYLDWLAEQLRISAIEDWYQVRIYDVMLHDVVRLIIRYYEASLVNALQQIYPQTEYFHAPDSFWNSSTYHRQYWDWFAEELQIESVADWYRLTSHDIGKIHFPLYENSLAKTLVSVYPSTEWKLERFHGEERSLIPKETQKHYFDWLAEQLGVHQIADWYRVTSADVNNRGGGEMLEEYYGNSIVLALTCVYENSCFVDAPKSFWEHYDRQLRFLQWIQDLLQVQVTPTSSMTYSNRLVALFSHLELEQQYQTIGSILRMLWMFTNNHRLFFDWVAEEFCIHTLEDWYGLDSTQVSSAGGTHLLSAYQNSLAKALVSTYPHSGWQPWKFAELPQSHWESPTHRAQYMDWVEEYLGVDGAEDWYGYTKIHLQSCFGTSLLQYAGGIFALVAERYPTFAFDMRMWNKFSGKKSELLCIRMAKSLLPDGLETVHVYPSSMLKYQGSMASMQLDMWIPQLNIALEYQGRQHYHHNHFWGEGFVAQISNDREKRRLCEDAGISLISVPYWWDFNSSTLAAAFQKYCDVRYPVKAELSIPLQFPYPTHPPKKTFEFCGIPYFEPAKCEHWNASVDPTNWWASVQIEGTGVISDGSGNFYNKVGRRVFIPPDIDRVLRGVPLEFVLCLEDEQDVSPLLEPLPLKVTSSQVENYWKLWSKVTIYVYDAPFLEGNAKERCEEARKKIQSHPNIKFVKYWRVESMDHILEWIRSNTGKHKGLFLRTDHPGYFNGKSPTFLKVRMLKETIATVVGYSPAKSALKVHSPAGELYWLFTKSSPKSMKQLYPIGSLVSVLYFNTHPKTQIPRNPRLIETRKGLAVNSRIASNQLQ